MPGLARTRDHHDAVRHREQRHHVTRHDERCAVQDDDIGDLPQPLRELPHGGRAQDLARSVGVATARQDGHAEDRAGLQVRGRFQRLAVVIHRSEQIGEARLFGDTELLVDGRPAQIAGDDEHAVARLRVRGSQVRGHGGLAVTSLCARDQDRGRAALRSGPSSRPDLDEAERVRRARIRMCRRHHALPTPDRDRGDLGEDGHPERLLGPFGRAEPSVEPLEHEREQDPEEQAEQGGEEHARAGALRHPEPVFGRRGRGAGRERTWDGFSTLELPQRDRGGPFDRECSKLLVQGLDLSRFGAALGQRLHP